VLASYPEPLSVFARKALEKRGVAVWTGSVVSNVEANKVYVGSEVIEAGTILWAAGVSASPLGRSLGVPCDRAGRVLVNDDLTVPGHPEVSVVGDLAALKDADGRWLPGVAQVAIQQAAHAAHNIVRTLGGQPRTPFRYRNLGNLATIGRNSAVADLPAFKMKGYLAWLFWLFVHIAKLIGFRSRLSVMTQWAFSYLTYQRSVRLITGDKSWRSHE
jgi:NADH dehydrogenase